jgi:hypothetical protein
MEFEPARILIRSQLRRLFRVVKFSSSAKVSELAQRGGAFKDLADQQAFEHGVENGRVGLYLKLTREQYGR